MAETSDKPGEGKGRVSVDRAVYAVESAFSTGKADRAEITARARDAALEAVRQADEAMEADEAADEAARLYVIAQNMGDRTRARVARDKARAARDNARREHEEATAAARVAFEQVKFSDPTKLGLMRLVQVLFAVHILFTIVALILTSRDTVSYSSANFTDWIVVVAESVAFWFFSNRYRLARPLCIGMGVFGIIMSALSMVAQSTFTLTELLIDSAYYVGLVCYFTFSARVRAVLVNELSREQAMPFADDFAIERSGWPFIRNLIIYFFVFSLLGHWMEAAMCQLIRLHLVQGSYDPTNTMLWRDWFYPYPMHGTAVVLIAAVLYPFFDRMRHLLKPVWKAYAVSYVAGALVCAAIELAGGLMFNADYQHWDYRNDFMNFMGQIDLQNTLAFGCAAAAITWFVYPTLERAISRVRPAVMNVVCIVVATIGAILFSLYVISPPDGIDLGANAGGTAQSPSDATIIEESIVAIEAGVRQLEHAVDASAETTDAAAYKDRLAAVTADLQGLLQRDWSETPEDDTSGTGQVDEGQVGAGDATAGDLP